MIPFLAVCLLLQAESAEETFKKIEESLKTAKSVRVQFVWDGATKSDLEGKVDARGNVLLKEGNRVNLVASVTEKAQTSELRIISDGKTVKSKLGPKRLLESETPKHLEIGLKMALHRLGAMQAVLIAHKICMLDAAEQEEALDLGKRPPLTDFRAGPDDGEWKTMTYKITPDGADSAAEVRLWYTPEGYKLVKRTITIKRPSESVFTETYKEWSVDAELDNDEFTLPSVK
jgi:outer membrane lipoprotein-sorting protein